MPMFDTIILVTGPTEQPVLASALKAHRPDLIVEAVETLPQLLAIRASVLQRARLIAFATTVIVPASVLEGLGFGAYNFHPGPPSYPGWAPAHFALYDGAREFGATAHAMVEQVDAGPIVAVELFPIPDSASATELEGLAYARLAKMFWDLAKPIATQVRALPALELDWSGPKNTRRRYQSLCDIPLDIAAEELVRRIKVFGGNDFDVCPTVRLHGVAFRIAS